MEIVINLLIAAHILAFIAGGSNSVVGPVIAGRLASATAEERSGYFGVMDSLSKVGKVSMVVLLVTGPLVVFLKYGGFGGVTAWFWIKMAFVAVMLIAIIIGGISFKRYEAGDAAAWERADLAHKVTGAAFIGVIIAAVFAFN